MEPNLTSLVSFLTKTLRYLVSVKNFLLAQGNITHQSRKDHDNHEENNESQMNICKVM